MGSLESKWDKLIVSADLQPLVDELLARGWDKQAILAALADNPERLIKRYNVRSAH
jgi:hypothetical protein